jgi:propionyl-CoA carboxylase alpha chain
VPHDDPLFLVALAAAANRRFLERAAGISGQMPGRGVRLHDRFEVVVKGAEGKNVHHAVELERNGGLRITVAGRLYDLSGDWRFGHIRTTGLCNGQPFTAQVERHGVWLHIVHNGLAIEALVLSPHAAQLAKLMPYKPPPDTSKFLLSPMPGLLADVVVEVGQQVQAGERLAVIEAMKMEDIMLATRAAVVAEVLANKGESLSVDQPILRFE